MTRLIQTTVVLLAMTFASPRAEAQESGTPNFTVHDRTRGELSPGTAAPRRETLMSALDSRSTPPSQVAALLEYGERVECHECVPLLTERMLNPAIDPTVREMAAWWLRRRPFGFGAVMQQTREVLATDADPRRRAVAAAAIGEFMDLHGVAHLGAALMNDADAGVRTAATLGLARINSPRVIPLLTRALSDSDARVVEAALRTVLRVNFWRDAGSVIPLLAHDDSNVRRRAALVIGGLRTPEAVAGLSAVLMADENEMTRQAAAWALGRIGNAQARTALTEAAGSERSSRVNDAIEVAIDMAR